MPVKIFFCYAREDEKLLIELKTHLKPLQRQGLIDVWHDRDISAGTEWETEIDNHLNMADIILLLISPDFINSDYCGEEMKQALELYERGEVHVIPVILRPVLWQVDPLGKLQALPTDAIPITSKHWHSLDDAFFDVAEGIRKAVEKVIPKSSPPSQTLPIQPSKSEPTLPQLLPKPYTPQTQPGQRPASFWYQSLNQPPQPPQYFQEEKTAQNNLFQQPPTNPRQEWFNQPLPEFRTSVVQSPQVRINLKNTIARWLQTEMRNSPPNLRIYRYQFILYMLLAFLSIGIFLFIGFKFGGISIISNSPLPTEAHPIQLKCDNPLICPDYSLSVSVTSVVSKSDTSIWSFQIKNNSRIDFEANLDVRIGSGVGSVKNFFLNPGESKTVPITLNFVPQDNSVSLISLTMTLISNPNQHLDFVNG